MITRNTIHNFGDKAVFVGILLLAGSMPLSKFGMSLGQFIIAGGWLLSGDVKEKFIRVFRNPVVWILWGVYFLHILALWHCHDFKSAGEDVRIKLPLLLMPLFFAGMKPLTDRQYRILMGTFVSGVVISSLISVAVYLGFTKHKVTDIRDISIFISHIRLSLLCCVSIVLLSKFIFIAKKDISKVIYLLLIGWLISFMILLQSVTGIGILSLGIVIYLFIYLFSKSTLPIARVVGFILLASILIGGIQLYKYLFIDSVKVVHVDFTKLPEFTHRGHRYIHRADRQDVENGNLVWIYLCDQEVDSAWKSKSTVKLERDHFYHTTCYYTLVRFLSSKGLTKDADGIADRKSVV